MSARARSQPRSTQAAPLPKSRTTARTGSFAAKRLRANSPPTLPVIPVIANITLSSILSASNQLNARRGRYALVLSAATRSKKSGKVFATHPGSLIFTPASLRPVTAKLIAIR